MNPYNFSVLFFSFGAFLLGILIYLRRKDSLGYYYLLFSTAAALWGVFFSIMVSGNVDYRTALTFARICNVAALFVPLFWLHVAMILSGNVQKNKMVVIYACGIVIGLLAFTPLFVPEVKSIAGFKYYTQAGPVFYFYTALFFGVTPLGFLEIIKKIKRAQLEEKIQLKGLMIATMVGFVAAFPTFLPCYGIDVPQYGLFFMPVYPFAMAYFLMRKDLFSVVQLAQAAHRDKMAAIGMLAASMNHEIRNPLYIIRGLAETHLEKFKDGIYSSEGQAIQKANEILKKAAEQSDRAMDLMKRFSMFAKQNVDQQFVKEPVSIAAVLEDILPLIQHELMLDQIELIRNVPESLKITADRRHLEEILFNLIVNACQAIRPADPGFRMQDSRMGKQESRGLKQGEIKVKAFETKSMVRVEISDNGPGIEEGQQKKIFDPFYTSKEEGTGLGLYITKQLVERNGGKISVKSELGKGTIFVLEFKA